MKVTTKVVLNVESELGKTILEVLEPATKGQGLPIKSVLVLLKNATGKSEEECLELIEGGNGIIVQTIEAYSAWISKAFGVAEAGN